MGAREDVVEHGFGEPAGKSVLLAGVIAAQQRARADRRLDAMTETRPWTHDLAEVREGAKVAVPGKAPQTHDAAHAREQTQLADEIRPAVVALIGGRAVIRWAAVNAGGDVAV